MRTAAALLVVLGLLCLPFTILGVIFFGPMAIAQIRDHD